MNRFGSALLASIPLLFVAGRAGAQETHPHQGLFLRPTVGFAWDDFSENGVDWSGVGGQAGIAIGGTVGRNLSVFGQIQASVVDGPTESNGNSSVVLNDSQLTLQTIGAGINYYFEPANLYLAGSLAFAQENVNTTSQNVTSNHSTNWGVAIAATVGKEWWVSPRWALGLAAQLLLGSVDDPDPNDSRVSYTMSLTSFALVFSATYN